jgi:hypothetical protein
MLKLTAAWQDRLKARPETGMTYTVVTVILKDGRTFPQAIVCEGSMGPIRSVTGVPFSEAEISELIPTHHKWEWNTGMRNS